MQPLSFFVHLLVVFALTRIYKVDAACRIPKELAEQKARILTVYTNNGLQLLYHDEVQEGTRLKLICNEQDFVEVTCVAGGIFYPNLPTNDCATAIKSFPRPVDDPSCGYKMYSINYGTDLANGFNFEFYRTCYSNMGLTPKFSIHTAYNFTLYVNKSAIVFVGDDVVPGAIAKNFTRSQVQERFKLLLGANQRYITSESEYVILKGHLAPAGDFLYKQGKNATCKYINVVPQFASINQRNWKIIKNWVRDEVRLTGKATIVTGTLDVLHLRSTNNTMVPMYLAENQRNPIPKWLYKIVVDDKVRIVFVTLNNIYPGRKPPPTCHEVPCPVTLTRNALSGFTHCCNVPDFTRKFLPNLRI